MKFVQIESIPYTDPATALVEFFEDDVPPHTGKCLFECPIQYLPQDILERCVMLSLLPGFADVPGVGRQYDVHHFHWNKTTQPGRVVLNCGVHVTHAQSVTLRHTLWAYGRPARLPELLIRIESLLRAN